VTTTSAATVRASQSLPGFIDPSLAVRLCFLDGAPPPGAAGSVSVSVIDYDIEAIEPTVTRSTDDVQHQDYSWDRLDRTATPRSHSRSIDWPS